MADTQTNNRIEVANRELEAAKVDTQLDEAYQHGRPQPRNRSRGLNLQTLILYRTFVLLENLRIGHRHLQEILMSKQVLSIMADQAHLLTGKPAVTIQQLLLLKQVMLEHPRTVPTATLSSASAVMTAEAPITLERQSLIEVEAVASASAVPILESWGLPQPDTVTN